MFVIAMALLPGASALGKDWATTPVPLANTGLEPNASGQATLTEVYVERVFDRWGRWRLVCHSTLTVTCQGLKPAAVYRIGQLAWYGESYMTPRYREFKVPKDGTGGYSGGVTFVNTSFPGEWPVGFRFSVDRKRGSNWDTVLTGEILRPAQ